MQVNQPLFICNTGIPQEKIKKCIDFITKFVNKSLRPDTFEKILSSFRANKISDTDTRYHAILAGSLNNIKNNDNCVYNLVNSLNAQLKEREIDCDRFDIFLEKGLITPIAPNWHFDTSYQTSVSVSFSNIPDWSTRILNKENEVKLFGEENGMHKLDTILRKESYEKFLETEKQVDLYSETTLIGHFYDVHKFLHRSPDIRDITVKETSIEDVTLSLSHLQISPEEEFFECSEEPEGEFFECEDNDPEEESNIGVDNSTTLSLSPEKESSTEEVDKLFKPNSDDYRFFVRFTKDK